MTCVARNHLMMRFWNLRKLLMTPLLPWQSGTEPPPSRRRNQLRFRRRSNILINQRRIRPPLLSVLVNDFQILRRCSCLAFLSCRAEVETSLIYFLDS